MLHLSRNADLFLKAQSKDFYMPIALNLRKYKNDRKYIAVKNQVISKTAQNYCFYKTHRA